MSYAGKERPLFIPDIKERAGTLGQMPSGGRRFENIIGVSPLMKKLCDLIARISDTESTVIIYGESGTGKEVVAKTIHNNSSRANNPFVPLNCSAIPKDLLESEFFGHEKGAFTGAINTRIGRFELADGGTLFLDEIGELHPSLQAKLLRAIQEREFERLGGTKTIRVDVRILAATNKDLEKAVKDGTFREDLFYRLNVISLAIPPLRQRPDDIPVLLEHFMGRFSSKKKKEPLRITSDVMASFMGHGWPGNVRELENLVERMVILDDDGVVTMDDLPDRFHAYLQPDKEMAFSFEAGPERISAGMVMPKDGLDLNAMLDEIERSMILQAMERAGGVKKKAATLLGLNRTTLLEKLKKKNIVFQDQDLAAHAEAEFN